MNSHVYTCKQVEVKGESLKEASGVYHINSLVMILLQNVAIRG
jgi:hypothetical protein